MAKYLVNTFLTISACKVIEAKNEAEAREKAGNLGYPSLCHQCNDSGIGTDDEWQLSGFDEPDPDNIEEVELYDGTD